MLDYGLRVRHSVYTDTASNYRSEVSPIRPGSSSLDSLDLDLEVHISAYKMRVSKHISEITWS